LKTPVIVKRIQFDTVSPPLTLFGIRIPYSRLLLCFKFNALGSTGKHTIVISGKIMEQSAASEQKTRSGFSPPG
jgi:hypothetical protein